ncbi:MAG TPA: hypothetical protein VG838_00590 [Opitutaceae bacterium]|nr:hypothetical protein [Opitutaceae bacterium]
MSRPKNKRLRKTYWHVAVRVAAVQGAHAAFPQLGLRELGAALGLTRHAVRHYLLGDIKSGFNREPEWSKQFFEGCRALATGNTTAAGFAFSQVAKLIAKEGPK